MGWLIVGPLGLAALGLAAWGLGQWHCSAKTRELLVKLEAASTRAPAERFDITELGGLPAPVARHLRQVLPHGSAIIRAVDVVHRGTFNMSRSGEQWRPFMSRQHVVARRPGFLWDGRVSMAPGLSVHVHDAYIDGEGILEPAILGLFTLIKDTKIVFC